MDFPGKIEPFFCQEMTKPFKYALKLVWVSNDIRLEGSYIMKLFIPIVMFTFISLTVSSTCFSAQSTIDVPASTELKQLSAYRNTGGDRRTS